MSLSGESKARWPVGIQGDVEDAVMAWLDKDDLASADGTMFDAIVAVMGLERVGWHIGGRFHSMTAITAAEAVAHGYKPVYRLTYSGRDGLS